MKTVGIVFQKPETLKGYLNLIFNNENLKGSLKWM
jgi:hypothetical protein